MGAEQAPTRGRPTEFEQETADEICRRLSEGDSLRTICLDEAMPARSTVFLWLRKHKSFSDQYARAREDQAEALADDVMDTALNKDLEPNDRRVRVDALKWLASKRKPKVYGDKVQTELTGRDGGPIQTIDLTQLSDADLDRLQSIIYPEAVSERVSGGEGEAEG